MNVLNDEQLSVLNSPLDARQVVVAPPGCGKTHTAIELLQHLDGFLDPDAEDQIVYISFSKAAIRAATEGHREALNATEAVIDIGTVDSFAFGVLYELERVDSTNSGLPGSSFFERRVQEALRALQKGESNYFETTQYLIVDEAQDIYGLRRQFVEAIIKELPAGAGVSIFGDPMQSIYQFLDGDGRESANDESLIQGALRDSEYSRIDLVANYRANTFQTKNIHTELRELDETTNRSDHRKVVDRVFASIPPIPIQKSMQNSSGALLFKRLFSQLNGTKAILTHRNAEVLWLSELVTDLGLQAYPRFRPGQSDRVPAWVAVWNERIGGNPFALKSVMDFVVSEFPEAVDGAILTGLDFTEPFETTTSQDLVEAFLRAPDSSPNPSAAGATVSTIHQAKGLEFDNVFVVNYEELLSDNYAGVQTSLAYVALTRARSRILNLKVDFPFMAKGQGSDNRSYVRSFRKRPEEIEIRPGDVEVESGIFADDEGTALMSTGAHIPQLGLELISQHTPLPKYRLKSGQTTLGITNQRFGEVLKSTTSSSPGSWPDLGPVLYDGAETATGNEAVHGRSTWLVPRPYGFSEIRLTKKKATDE